MKKKVFIPLLCAILLLGAPLVLLDNSRFQHALFRQLSDRMAEATGMDIRFEEGRLSLFPLSLRIDRLHLADSLSRPVASLASVEVDPKGWAFLKGRYLFDKVRLDGLQVELWRADPYAPLNISALPTLVMSGDSSRTMPEWAIASLVVQDVSVSFDVLSDGGTEPNPMRHIHVENGRLKGALSMSSPERFNVRIDDLSFVTQEGFCMDSMRLDVSRKGSLFSLNALGVDLPDSRLRVDTCRVYLPGLALDSIEIVRPLHLNASLKLSDMPGMTEFLGLSGFEQETLATNLRVEGNAFDLRSETLQASLGKDFSFDARMRFRLDSLGIMDADVHQARFDAGRLPEPFNRLGNCLFAGEVELSFPPQKRLTTLPDGSRASVAGSLFSDPGQLDVDARVVKAADTRLEATVDTWGFDLGRCLEINELYGLSAFHLEGSARLTDSLLEQACIEGRLSAIPFHEHVYRDIDLAADYSREGDCHLSGVSHDPDCRFTIDALTQAPFKMETLPYHVDLKVDRLDLEALHFRYSEEAPQLASLALSMNGTGLDWDTPEFTLALDSLCLSKDDIRFVLDSMRMESAYNGQYHEVTIASDLMRGSIMGDVHFRRLLDELADESVHRYLPSLTLDTSPEATGLNNFQLQLEVDSTGSLPQVLGLPVALDGPARAQAYFYAESDLLWIGCQAVSVRYGDREFRQVESLLHNEGSDELKWSLSGECPTETDAFRCEIGAVAVDDSIELSLKADNPEQGIAAAIKSVHRLNRIDEVLNVASRLDAPAIQLKEEIWSVYGASRWNGEKLSVDTFTLRNDQQYLDMFGEVSASRDDSLCVSIHRLDLETFAAWIPRRNPNAKPLVPGGVLTARATLSSLLDDPVVEADVAIEHGSLSSYKIGNVTAHSRLNHQTNSLDITAKIDDGRQELGMVSGSFCIDNDSLGLIVDSYGVPLEFISAFTDRNFRLGGKAYGPVYVGVMPGKDEPVDIVVATDADVQDGWITINLLGSKYHFSDSVHLEKGLVRFRNITLYDDNFNRGTYDAVIRHTNFKNFLLDMNIAVNRFKVMDIPVSATEPFCGVVYASGNVRLSGPDQNLQVDVDAVTTDKSVVRVNASGLGSGDSNYAFLEFTSDQDKEVAVPNRKRMRPRGGRLQANVELEVTPDVELAVLTSAETGDEMKMRGNGNLRITFDTNDRLDLFGRYTLENGSYNMSIQDVISRNFVFSPGSYINFTGDPLQSNMDINAHYAVHNVSLSPIFDEAEMTTMNLTRSGIPVNCTMNISGQLSRPDIGLGLAFPSADEELKRRILNRINTDELINRQLIYLLVFKRFASLENNANVDVDNVDAVVGMTLNTLSNQLNRMIYNALGSDNISLGFNYRNAQATTGIGEWQVALNSQFLDNRLIINGNIGSREDLVSAQTQFIGDFDLEYKFSQSGRWRVKMFNRSNDSRYFKSAMTTQGVGMVYKEHFHTLSQLRETFVQRIVRQMVKSKSEADIRFPKKTKEED